MQRGGHGKRPSKVLIVRKEKRRRVVEELACAGGSAAEEREADEVQDGVLRRREAV